MSPVELKNICDIIILQINNGEPAMKKLYSSKNYKYYTMLRQILYDLKLTDKDYLWLISDIEAYPHKEEYQNLIENNYLILSTKELLDMLDDDDFQWIWAVFSAIPSTYTKEEILSFDLPYIQNIEIGKYNPHADVPKFQHPYSDFELYAVDSSYIFLITDNNELINQFKKSYPSYTEE